MLELLAAVAIHLAAPPTPAPPSPVPPAVLDGVRWAESRGRWLVRSRSGRHHGPYQVGEAWAELPVVLLYVEPLGRAEADRLIRRWLRRSGGQLAPAMAAYRCGNGGLRGECGRAYAAAVLERAGLAPATARPRRLRRA